MKKNNDKVSKTKKKYWITKHNKLNFLQPDNMTLAELRFFTVYLSKINPLDENTRIVQLTLSDFQKIFELKQVKPVEVLKISRKLLSKTVIILLDCGGFEVVQLFKRFKLSNTAPEWKKIETLSRVDLNPVLELIKDEYWQMQENFYAKIDNLYSERDEQWYIEMDAHDEVLPLLFNLKEHYFKYQLWNALKLKSVNQLRMYEILKQYENLGKRILYIEELKIYLGIDRDSYADFSNFKKKVLDACQKALSTYTDIQFEYEPYGKRGRGGKIIQLKFTITKNKSFKDSSKVEELVNLLTNTHKEIPTEGSELMIAPITVAELEEKIIAVLEKAPELPSIPIEPTVLAEKMYSYYKSLDWHTLTGRPIKNWTALVRKWIKDEKVEEKMKKSNNRRSKFHNFTQKSTDYAELEKMNQQLMLEKAKKLGI